MKIKKRMRLIAIGISLSMLLLILRLADIQLIHTESFSDRKINLIEESVSQRTQEVMIDDGRGRIVDRNKNALVQNQEAKLVLFPFLNKVDWPVTKLSGILNVSSMKIQNLLKTADKPLLLGADQGFKLTDSMMNQINKLEIPGVFAIYQQTKISHHTAGHIIGITGENAELLRAQYPEKKNLSSKTQLGITGLQKAFDEFLLPDAETKLLYHVDGDGNPLFGINVKYIADANPFYPVSIKTTIDSALQDKMDEIMNRYNVKKGGLVLLDVETSEVLAMVSKPNLNRSDPDTYSNQMLTAIAPGSVFKTVIAAAGIESGVGSDKKYDCSLNMYGENNGEQDEGILNVERSFAKSCNYAFTSMANELMKEDRNVVETFAWKLGLTEKAGWSGPVYHYDKFMQFPEEKNPSIWGEKTDKGSVRAIAQTAIGQKNVRVTPLSVANMMAAIARGGQKKQVKIVDSILYKNGTTMFKFPENEQAGDSISPYTASKLQHLLRLVVTDGEGTGRRFQTLPIEVSGKSGTAETGKGTVHKWFAGYFPSKNPKYALAVVEMDTTSPQSVANSIFYDAANELAQLENASTR